MIQIRMIAIAAIFILYTAMCILSGYYYCKGGEGEAIIEQLEEDSEAVEMIKTKAEIRYVEVEKIKKGVELVVDTSGCLDVPITEPVITDSLYNAYNTSP